MMLFVLDGAVSDAVFNSNPTRSLPAAFVIKDSGSNSQLLPCYQVEDGSTIQVQETKNAFQRSLAQNAFSKRCIEANLYAIPC